MRRCIDCPEWTRTVCRHAFGRYWGERSGNAAGCAHPVDDVAEAWRKAGWAPETGATRPITLPVPAMPRRPKPTMRQAEMRIGGWA